MALRFFRQLYSLDTLDTRFVVPATAPPKEALRDAELDPAGPLPTVDGKSKSRGSGDAVQPARWNTPEFYVYYVTISASIFMMLKLPYDCSKGRHFIEEDLIYTNRLRITSHLLAVLPPTV